MVSDDDQSAASLFLSDILHLQRVKFDLKTKNPGVFDLDFFNSDLIAPQLHQDQPNQLVWRLGFIMCYNIFYHKFRSLRGHGCSEISASRQAICV